MRSLLTSLFICALSLSASAHAMPLEGSWKFESSIDFFGRKPAKQAPRYSTLRIHNDRVFLSEACSATFAPEQYLFPDVFQPLTKQGATEKQVDAFLLKNLNLSLSQTKEVFTLGDAPGNCSRPMMEFIVVGERMLVPAGATFYTYVKVQDDPLLTPSVAGVPATTLLAGYKLSKLPMSFERYNTSCTPKILNAKGKPGTSAKCAPDYYPYVADPKSTDPIMKLVGNHDYGQWGQTYTAGFSPPFQQKIPATFLVFAPMKQVILVRVDDLELVRNEERDMMSGVYISILDGKVIDQIAGCDMNPDYVCMSEGLPRARLTDSGKFKPL